MENQAKKNGKLICFLPITAYALWSIAFLLVNRGHIEMSSLNNHFDWMRATLANYQPMLWTFVLCAVIAFSVLLYLIVHIARLKDMGAGDKIAWIMFMACFGPLGFPVFYYMELRNEPDRIEVYPDIA